MSIGAGIATAAIWLACAAIVAIFNTRIGTTNGGFSPFGALVLAGIACGATYYVMGGR